jgi:hypothetical protein
MTACVFVGRRQSHHRWFGAVVVLAMASSGARAAAQDRAAPVPQRPSDTLVVNAELTDIGGGSQGGSAAVEWLHPLSPSKSVNAGVGSFSLVGTSWTYGRAGALWRASRTTLHGQADLGAGHDQRGSFAYRVAQATVEQQLVPGRLSLEVQDRFIDIDRTAGNVVKLGMTLVPMRALALSGAVHSATAGNLDARFASVRVDGYSHGATVFGGVSGGRSHSTLVGLADDGSPGQNLLEVAAGVTVPIKRLRITLGIDSLHLGETRRQTLTMNWTVPF